MDCLHPIYLDDPDEFDYNEYCRLHGYEYRIKKVTVPCGRCESCLYSNAQEWRVRIDEEFHNSENALFITLTYNDESLPFSVGTNYYDERVVVPSVSKRDIQLFLKRLRSYYHSSAIRYFIVSEYGPTTLRPHYHGILFNIPDFNPHSQKSLSKVSEIIAKNWNNGFVKCDLVNPARVGYVTKYICSTMDLPREYVRPFRLMSRRPAIGFSYFDRSDRLNWHRRTLSCYVPDGVYKLRMPRYYKRRIFDDEMLYYIRQFAENRRIEESLSRDDSYERDLFYAGVDVKRDKLDKFIRNFNNKYVKKRKDL
ncbi:replication initiator protein [Dipodfec virus UA23Rod_1363]|uniref:Replication initiator protein n=1 Tax=Dipodfec virus UA23Rod_1363 TaxID=2929331 RepID=A0A976R7L7_9VIRU|nr:replication initiator protein [Dipodfec virus UA23Rod_1363]